MDLQMVVQATLMIQMRTAEMIKMKEGGMIDGKKREIKTRRRNERGGKRKMKRRKAILHQSLRSNSEGNCANTEP